MRPPLAGICNDRRCPSRQFVLTASALCLFALLCGCPPSLPKAERPVQPLPGSVELQALAPVTLALAPTLRLETDSRGWNWWQNEVRPGRQMWLLAPIGYALILPLTPILVPAGAAASAGTKEHIRRIAEETDATGILLESVRQELDKTIPAGIMTDPAARPGTLLELTAITIYLDNAALDDYKWNHKLRSRLKLIIVSGWSLRDAASGRDYGSLTEVTDRLITPSVRVPEIWDVVPNELLLLIDEHARTLSGHILNP